MKLTDEERQIVVGLQMEKAHRFLEQADEMCRQKYWDIASNRYYYACYHAVQALLIKNELVAHTHDGLLTQFGLHFVKAGKVESRLGKLICIGLNDSCAFKRCLCGHHFTQHNHK